MPTVVGVRFKQAGKIYYFDPRKLTVVPDDEIIVETAWGKEYGRVVIGPRDVREEEIAVETGAAFSDPAGFETGTTK